jgi:hypothetical protein
LIALGALSAAGMRKARLFTISATNPASAQARTPPPIKVISITVNPRGFNPSRITVPEGLYLIDINNRSGLPELNLQLGALNNRKLKESRRPKDSQGRELKSQDWRGFFNLDRGVYTVMESSHPNWVLQIQVDRKQ